MIFGGYLLVLCHLGQIIDEEYQILIFHLLLTENALIATRNNATIAVLCLPHFNAGTAKKFVPIK